MKIAGTSLLPIHRAAIYSTRMETWLIFQQEIDENKQVVQLLDNVYIYIFSNMAFSVCLCCIPIHGPAFISIDLSSFWRFLG